MLLLLIHISLNITPFTPLWLICLPVSAVKLSESLMKHNWCQMNRNDMKHG